MTNSANKKGTASGIWHTPRGYNHEIFYAYESLSCIPYCVICSLDLSENELYFIKLRDSF